jgi:DNA-binding CsgD family transcriptional regulator
MNSITSDESGGGRTVGKESMPNEGLLSVEVNGNDSGLTQLEKQVVALTVAGYSSQEAAKRIGISEPSTRLHIASICDKLCVSNQFELVLFALHHQLVDIEEMSPAYDR